MSPIAALNFKLFQEPVLPVAGTVDLAPFLIMTALLTGGAAFLRWRFGGERQWLRRVTQTAATLAFVIGLHPCACMVRDLLRGARQISINNVEAFLLMSLIIPVTAFAMVFGRVFCGWVCPIGFIQELASKLTNWMRSSHWREPMKPIRFFLGSALLLGAVVVYLFVRPANEPALEGLSAGFVIALSVLVVLSVADRRWEYRLRTVRYAVLAFFVVSTLLDVYLQAAFCVLFTNDVRQVATMLFAGVLFASLVLSQAWCRFLCPEGALLGWLTRLSGWKVRLDPSRCTRCNTCNDVCPVEAIDFGRLDEKSCLYCCRCVDMCQDRALTMAGEPSPDSGQ